MKRSDGDFRALIHKPDDLATSLIQWAEKVQAEPGIKFGVPSVDRKIIPLRPGTFAVVCARPGHGKSSLLAVMAKREAASITARGMEESECVVFVTWETSAEALAAMFLTCEGLSISDIAWGKVDLNTLSYHAMRRVTSPIWVIGHGIGRAGKRVPRMTPEVVYQAIETMHEDYGRKPTLILFDYIQIVPVQGFRDRVQQVTEVPFRLKELALRIGVPAVAASQANRDVDGRREKIPELRDNLWASSVEQVADLVLALWRPWQTKDDSALAKYDEFVEIRGTQFPITERLFVMRMLKQRGEAGRHTWALHFDMPYLKLAELESDAEEKCGASRVWED
jgi:replicative DNA helicase